MGSVGSLGREGQAAPGPEGRLPLALPLLDLREVLRSLESDTFPLGTMDQLWNCVSVKGEKVADTLGMASGV